MTDYRFALFDSAIGACAVVWSGRGVAGVQLPEKGVEALRGIVARRFAGAQETPPPQDVRDRKSVV